MIVQFNSQTTPNYLQSNSISQLHINPHKSPRVSSKKLNPNNKNSHSYEVPTNFIHKKSVINDKTYNNQYINNPIETNKTKPLYRQQSICSINNFKFNDNLEKQQKDQDKKQSTIKTSDPIINLDKELKLNQQKTIAPDDFQKLYTYKKETEGFNKKLGIFSDFVKQNDCLNVYGHLLTNQRGLRRETNVYDIKNKNGQSVPRFSHLNSFLNPDISLKYKKSVVTFFDQKKKESISKAKLKNQQSIDKCTKYNIDQIENERPQSSCKEIQKRLQQNQKSFRQSNDGINLQRENSKLRISCQIGKPKQQYINNYISSSLDKEEDPLQKFEIKNKFRKELSIQVREDKVIKQQQKYKSIQRLQTRAQSAKVK